MSVPTRELTDDLALRIGLASRELAPLSPRVLITRLQALFGGHLPSRERMRTLTPCQLRPVLQSDLPDLSGKRLKAALHWLTTWEPDPEPGRVDPESIAQTPPGGVVRVAMASMGRGQLDGHFASCSHFVIHDVAPDRVQWVAERAVPQEREGLDKVEIRLPLIRDSRILVVTSIGGPAAARVTRTGLLPIKVTDGMVSSVWLENLRQVLAGTPPPWLRRCL
ncbi:MAG: hypothetical protein HQL87_18470 [Magnetococcales bacterium]|nr:hypothetical protein [Magnetococcales bacterium]